MSNVPTSLNNLKTNVDGLHVGKLKTVDLKKLSDAVDEKVVKKTAYNILNIKVNTLEKTIPDVLFNSNKSIQHRQNCRRCRLEKEAPDISGLATAAVLNTKIGDFEHKIPDVSKLVKKAGYDVKISETEGI